MLVTGAIGTSYLMVCALAGKGAPLWPVLGASVIFLYLWWLSALLFDLAFVWHRYIRQDTAIDRAQELMTGVRRVRTEVKRPMSFCRRRGR